MISANLPSRPSSKSTGRCPRAPSSSGQSCPSALEGPGLVPAQRSPGIPGRWRSRGWSRRDSPDQAPPRTGKFRQTICWEDSPGPSPPGSRWRRWRRNALVCRTSSCSRSSASPPGPPGCCSPWCPRPGWGAAGRTLLTDRGSWDRSGKYFITSYNVTLLSFNLPFSFAKL